MIRRAPSTPPDLPGLAPVRLLGSGGFADVFLYEQKLPRRKVAVKVLLIEQLTSATRAQFVAEANLMAQLSTHPYIVTIFHADVSADGRPYFVMEFCPGLSLSERYKRAPFAVEDALRTGVRIAGAVATAHAAGILHRDIKPANVLTNEYGWPALTDFGISSNLEGELPVHTITTTGARDGTGSGSGPSAVGMSVPWSPPEMFADEPRPDQRSDVFSVAATVHTLLAGRTPFEVTGRPNGSLDLMGRIERGRITPIARAEVPPSLEAVLAKGMAVSRDDRFPTAVEFARALQRVELELGYAATSIEVPNLPVDEGGESGGDDGGDENDGDAGDDVATRARAVRTVEAQTSRAALAPTPDADATRARTPREVAAQTVRPTARVADATVLRPGEAVARPATDLSGLDDGTVVRVGPAQLQRRASEGAAAEASVAMEADDATATSTRARRSPVALLVGGAAAVVVAAVVGIAIAFSGTVAPGDEPETSAGAEDAVLAGLPRPVVAFTSRSADGTSAVFTVQHLDPAEGDRYRWERVDGAGGVEVIDGPDIVVADLAADQTVCIDVQVQRGSKTSEATRGCTP